MQAVVPGGDVRPACLFSGTELKTINDFLFQSKIDNINLFKVGHHLRGWAPPGFFFCSPPMGRTLHEDHGRNQK